MTPKWLWTLQGHRCPINVLLVSMCPKFHSISLYDEPFSSYRPFWEKCTKWPQNYLEPYKVKLRYIYVLQISTRPKFHCFALRRAVFELQAILRKVHWMTPKWPWTLQGHRYQINVLLVSMSPKFHSVSLYDQPFSRYRPFWNKCTEWPQNDLNPYKFKCTQYIYNYCTWVPIFTPFRSMTSPFRDTGHFETSALNDPKLTLKPKRSNYPIYV